MKKIKILLKSVSIEGYDIRTDCAYENIDFWDEVLKVAIESTDIDATVQQKLKSIEGWTIHLFDTLDENFISFYSDEDVYESEALEIKDFVLNYIFENYTFRLEQEDEEGLYEEDLNAGFYTCIGIYGIINLDTIGGLINF